MMPSNIALIFAVMVVAVPICVELFAPIYERDGYECRLNDVRMPDRTTRDGG